MASLGEAFVEVVADASKFTATLERDLKQATDKAERLLGSRLGGVFDKVGRSAKAVGDGFAGGFLDGVKDVQGAGGKFRKVFSNATSSAKKDVKGLDSEVGGLGDRLGGLGGLAKAAFAGFAVTQVTQGINSAIQAAASFDAQLREVSTLLSAEQLGSLGGLDALGDEVNEFAKEFGTLPEEVVPALYQAISAGVPTDNVFTFLETAQQAAIGGVTDLETAVDGISSVVNAYGSDVIDAAEASDLMFTAVRLGKTDFESLSSSLFNVAPLAAGLGIQFEDVTAGLAALTAQGVPTKVATTQLRSAFAELSKEGQIAADNFEQIAGETFVDFIAGGGNVEEAFRLMADSAAESGVPVQNLFGSIEAGSAVLALTSENSTFASALAEMGEAAGATATAFAKIDESPARALEKLSASVSVLQGELGRALLPALDALLPIITNVVDTVGPLFATLLRDIVEGVGPILGVLVEALAGLAPVITPVLEVFGQLAGALGSVLAPVLPIIVDAFAVLGEVLGDVAGRVLPALQPAMDAILGVFESLAGSGVITALAETIGILAGFFVELLALQVERFVLILVGAFEAFSPVIGVILDALNELLPVIGGALLDVFAALTPVVVALTRVFQTISAELLGVLVEAVITLVEALLPLVPVVVLLAEVIADVLVFALDLAVPLIEFLAGLLSGALVGALNAVIGPIVAVVEALVGFVSSFDDIADAVGDFGEDVLDFFVEAFEAVVEFVEEAVEALVEFFVDLPGDAVDALKALPRNVLRVLTGAFRLWTKTVGRGIVEVVKFFATLPIKVGLTLASLGILLVEKMTDAFRFLGSAIPRLIAGAADFFRTLPERIVSSLSSFGASLAATFRSAFDTVTETAATWFVGVLDFYRSLPGRVVTALASFGTSLAATFRSAFDRVTENVQSFIASTIQFFRDLPGRLVSLAGSFANSGRDLIAGLLRGMGEALGRAGSFASDIGKGVANAVIRFVNSSVIDRFNRFSVSFDPPGPLPQVTIDFPNLPRIPALAQGGLTTGPALALIGEDGGEAVVPFTKNDRMNVLAESIVAALNRVAPASKTTSSSTVAPVFHINEVGDARLTASAVLDRLAIAARG